MIHVTSRWYLRVVSRRLVLAAVGALAASAFLVQPVSSAAPEPEAAPLTFPPDTQYVALGDSFAAGPGILPVRPGSPAACRRSQRNFASLFAERTGLVVTDASCSGATTAHLTTAQGQNPPQFDALSAQTDLVSFGTIGGNDIGLVDVAIGCVLSDCDTSPTRLDPKFAQLAAELPADLAEAKSRAPNARILVIGYGTYLPPSGCNGAILGVSDAEAAYVQSQIDRLSDLLASAAQAAGATFIDMRQIPHVLEHTACAQPQQQWIRAINTYDDGAQLHPSYCGMDAMAQHVVRTLQGLAGEELTPFDNSCVSAGPPPPTTTPPTTPTTPVTSPPAPVPATPTPEQVRAQRLAALREAAATVALRTSCRGRAVTMRATGGAGHVVRARFKVGTKVVGKDGEAPFAVRRPVRRLPRHGALVVKTWLREGDLGVTRSVRVPRPSCMR